MIFNLHMLLILIHSDPTASDCGQQRQQEGNATALDNSIVYPGKISFTTPAFLQIQIEILN